jgi:hypothetical protein
MFGEKLGHEIRLSVEVGSKAQTQVDEIRGKGKA